MSTTLVLLCPRPPRAQVENDNGACCCGGTLHTWGDPVCVDAAGGGQ
ncbi:hypothetical protein L6E12_20990 [Actinokineospora sp. PR83]|nr:hypothetical protein [Actinokineospora sp. PR83]MCG8918263.1 hypothetical protein [Actinokineospora sp. PR83]